MEKTNSASLCKEIGLTSKLLGIYINEKLQLSGLQLTRNQFVVLKILSIRNAICQNELAFITERDKTSLTRLINTLEIKGMVKRKVDNKDKRKKIIYITKQGEESLYKALPLMEKLENKLVENINNDEIENLLRALNKVQSNVLNLSTTERYFINK